MAKKASVKSFTPLPGTHKLILQSLRLIKSSVKPFVKIAVVSAVVNLLLQLLLTPDASSLYQGLWFLFTSCALIWAVRHVKDKQVKLTLRAAYYEGTAPVLKFFLVTCVVAIATLPFSFGIFIFLTVSRLALGSLLPIVLSGLAWALLSVATIVLLSRWTFALPIVTLPQMRPIESLRISWALTKGRTRQIVVRLGIVLLYIIILAVLTVVLLSLISTSNTAGLALLGLMTNIFIIPFFYVYLFQLYHELT